VARTTALIEAKLMWARKRLDVRWSDLAFGLLQACLPADRRAAQRRVECSWSGSEDVLACLSVRSGFDLLLGALQLPTGSEVLVSAITIRHMIEIIEQHGLVPIPVDLDGDRLAPRLDLMRRAVTPATRAILVAHLFGSRMPLRPILDLASEHQLLVIEDCAQAFAGTQYQGHPLADVSMFSFGTIKAATALGGALIVVRNGQLLQRMRILQATCPVQTRWSYVLRLLKGGVLKGIASRPVYGVLIRVLEGIGRDPDRLINGSVRGFRGGQLLAGIRRQPSAPLLAVLRRRLHGLDSSRREDQRLKAAWLARLLDRQVTCPTATALPHTHWVFPILVDDPHRAIARLRRAGFDATQGESLSVVPAPSDRPWLDPCTARHALSHAVFLPVYPEMPVRSLRRMAHVLACEPSEFAGGHGWATVGS
jgi:dTDP-4-amino-4,6-dideoxygalactose transaminase